MQAATVVVIAEPQWKPRTEDQAVARAHWMGQIRTVQVHRLLPKGSVDDRTRETQENKTLLFDEFARKSDAKDADRRAVDTEEYRPALLDDESVPLQQRVILAEEYRLARRTGHGPTAPGAGQSSSVPCSRQCATGLLVGGMNSGLDLSRSTGPGPATAGCWSRVRVA